MNRDRHIFNAKTRKPKNGRPELEIHGVKDWNELAQVLYDHFGGKRLIIQVFIDDEGPADNERKYFHAVVKKYCQRGFYDIGYRYSEERTYDELKREYRQIPAGEKTPSFSSIPEAEYHAFIEWCCQFAAENLGVTIPPPMNIAAFPTKER